MTDSRRFPDAGHVWGPLFSRWGKETALQEATMESRQPSTKSLKSITGAALVALGLLMLFANVDGVVSSMGSFASLSANESLGAIPALGLAALHAMQAYTLDRAGFFSALRQILVSFWPLLLVILGGILLRYAFGGWFGAMESRSSSAARGDRS
jgi:hypothetical protein